MKRALFIILFFMISFIGQSQIKNFIDQPYVEVSGSADTLVTPDEIFIKINISERDTKNKISVEELETKMVNVLKALSIDVEKNLKMVDMISNFKTYLLKHKDVMKSKEYLLKVNNAGTASKVFIQLENLGISNTSIDHVGHSDIEEIRNMMRRKAVKNALEHARALTAPLNQNIGPAIYIADKKVYNQTHALQGRMAGVVVTGYGAKSKLNQKLPDIGFKKIKVTSDINVKFILKP